MAQNGWGSNGEVSYHFLGDMLEKHWSSLPGTQESLDL